MPLECFTEKIPVKHSVGWKSFPILIPPDACRSLQLVSCILRLQTFSQPKQAELLCAAWLETSWSTLATRAPISGGNTAALRIVSGDGEFGRASTKWRKRKLGS